MVHGYKTLQHWNQWLDQQLLGRDLLCMEEQALEQLLSKHFGKHALLIGVPQQNGLLKASSIVCHSLISPLIDHNKDASLIESDFHELPILTGSIDLVLLPHTLEFVDNPRQLLAEACRIIKPEGLIVICGFNPYSMWGIRKLFSTHKHTGMPWRANFIQASKVKSWLHLADFALEKHQSILFRPPVTRQALYKRLQFLENIGKKCFPHMGGSYILLARAQVIPLTPIKMQWKQQLGNIRIANTITGNIARRSK